MPRPPAGERDERESLWSVSVGRLPYYLLVFAVVVLGAAIAAIATNTTGKSWATVFTVAGHVAAVSTASFGIMVAVEGLIVGLTRVILDRARERAREEGIRQGAKRERERLRKLGVPIPDEVTTKENERKSDKQP